MTGPFLNAIGILLGALLGLVRRGPLAPDIEKSCQKILAALTVLCGLHLVWSSLGGGPGRMLKQLLIAVLALLAGNWTGRLLRFQKTSNRIGRHAAGLLEPRPDGSAARPLDGLKAATLLFCASPLGIAGAVTDGLAHYFFPLAIKAVMDGLAMSAFVKSFRWPAALAALPVFLAYTALAMAVNLLILPRLPAPELVQSINAAAGLILCASSLVILQVRRVELANYLPALVFAPVVSYFWI